MYYFYQNIFFPCSLILISIKPIKILNIGSLFSIFILYQL